MWHRHVDLVSGRAHDAEQYTLELVYAVLQDAAKQLFKDGDLVQGCIGMVVNEEEQVIWTEDEAYDDVSGARLDPAKVAAARA